MRRRFVAKLKIAMPETPWLLDTSILIDLLRGFSPARTWIDSLDTTHRAISCITHAELLAGCRNRREQRLVERELTAYTMIWLDERLSRQALAFYQTYRLSHNVGFFDCLVAATALTHHHTLATLNLKHFEIFPALTVKRPY
jgi:predicted nucleic acid-binding protein